MPTEPRDQLAAAAMAGPGFAMTPTHIDRPAVSGRPPGKKASAGAKWTSDPDARAPRINLLDWTQLLMEKKGRFDTSSSPIRPCVVHPSRDRLAPCCSCSSEYFLGLQLLAIWHAA